MLKLKLTALSVFGMSIMLISAPVASAEPFNPENKLHFYGKVLAAHHVVVNSEGKIQQIVSNTNEDVEPRVYLDRISEETQIDASESVNHEYRQLVPYGSSRVGVLYEYKAESKPLSVMTPRYNFLTNFFVTAI